MFRRRMAAALLWSLLLAQSPVPARQAQQAQPPTQAQPTPGPTDPVQRIREEGMNRSQVMQTLVYLTDVIGPRLTNSPGMKRANEWTRDRLTAWGLQNARLEAWGPFGRGWSLRRFSAEVVEPLSIPLVAFPKAWSPGTDGPLVAEVVYVDATNEQELLKFKGALRGRVVLNGPAREVRAHFEPEASRATEKELLDLANAPDPASRPPRQSRFTPEQRQQIAFAARRLTFFEEEGAALILDPSRGDGGNIFVQQATLPQPAAPETPGGAAPAAPAAAQNAARPWDRNAPKFAPQVVLSVEQYNRLTRMIQAGERVRVSINLEVQFHEEDLMGYNTVAEIPGSDLREEVVMLGGHLDSWHGGTGATDNAAGVAVAMEAVRILKALNLQPRRTIRVALWSGEEQGLLGSPAYVGPGGRGIRVTYLHPAGDIRKRHLGDGGVVVVDEQVRQEGGQLPLGPLRRGGPHLEARTVVLDREGYGLAVHPRRQGYKHAYHPPGVPPPGPLQPLWPKDGPKGASIFNFLPLTHGGARTARPARRG